MEVPEPAAAPVMPPVLVPSVQAKVLGAVDVRLILGLVPLQIAAVVAVVLTGAGFTVTVMFTGAPIQDPPVEVGVML